MRTYFIAAIFVSMALIVVNKKTSNNALLYEIIEALSAEGENDTNNKTKICWNDLDCDESKGQLSVTKYCGTCTDKPYVVRSNQNICKERKEK